MSILKDRFLYNLQRLNKAGYYSRVVEQEPH